MINRVSTALIAGFLTLGVGACTPWRLSAQSSYCITGDGRDQDLKEWVISLATAASGSEKAAERDSLRIPIATANGVAIVTDSRICEKAGQAFSSFRDPGSTAKRRVYVIKVGTEYVVFDPSLRQGDGLGAVFTSKWVFKESFL